MSHLDKYRSRLSRNGTNTGEVYASNTIAFIEATFQASPTFRVLEVVSTEFPEITQMDARVVEVERMGTLREVLFRPNQGLNIGTYVKFDGGTWLIFDKWGSTQSHTGLKVLVEKCNRTLKWKDANGIVQEIDCIATQSPLGSKANQGKNDIEWNKYDVRLPLGQLYVFVEKNDITSTISLNHRFIFGSNVYEVFGIDDTSSVDNNGFGVIQLTVKVATKQDADDFQNRIAFNQYETPSTAVLPTDGGENPVDGTNEDSGNGGLMW
jgi:hypothetical protein